MFNSGIRRLPYLDMVVGVKRIHREISKQRAAAMDQHPLSVFQSRHFVFSMYSFTKTPSA